MNSRILGWFDELKKTYPKLFWGNRVIEFGSLDVNGSPRSKFDKPIEYIGVDAQPGPGVNFIGLTHKYDNGSFDVVISTEMLEHDPYWDLSLAKMLDIVRIGGSFMCTWAGPQRPQHGADRYTPLNHYYRNISAMDAYRVLGNYKFKITQLWNNMDSFLNLFCYQKF